jgi:hypothetical protein
MVTPINLAAYPMLCNRLQQADQQPERRRRHDGGQRQQQHQNQCLLRVLDHR